MNQPAPCDLCSKIFPDTELVALFTALDDGSAPSELRHVECLDCHRGHESHSNDAPPDGPELCATLREFRDGTVPLGWWTWWHYYAMREIEVEDGQDSDIWLYGFNDWSNDD